MLAATKKTKTKTETKSKSKTETKSKTKFSPKSSGKPAPKSASKPATTPTPQPAPKRASAAGTGASAKASVGKSPSKKSPSKKAPATKPAATPKSGKSAVAAQKGGLVAVGAPAPAFSLSDASGKTVNLASLKGKPAVIFFYPQDDTPGCTVESCAFRDNRPKFAKLGCPVIGVSPDSVASHQAFDAKYRLGLTLLADTPGAGGAPAMAAAYGVWQEKNMYGRKYMGIVRTTYVLAKDGTVAARFDRVKVDGHAEEVLAAVEALG